MSREIVAFEQKAKSLRKDVLEMIYNAQSGHIGGSYSMMDVLVALFYDEMKFDPKNPKMKNRDRFVLSKGHAAPGLYAVLADKGFFPKEYLCNSFRCINGKLQGHPDMKKTPGIEISSGSLGMGLSASNGMALGNRYQHIDSYIFCMIGDGELDEGQVWEAAATAVHYHLNKVIAFVDMNGLQNDNETVKVKNMGNIVAKWKAFGWNAVEIDGHNFREIFKAIDDAKKYVFGPSVIICHTVKGKGISFMENVVAFHGKIPSLQEYERGLQELS
jgi:transketolase